MNYKAFKLMLLNREKQHIEDQLAYKVCSLHSPFQLKADLNSVNIQISLL